MAWTVAQQIRLQMERGILSKYFPAFRWINPTNPFRTHIEGNVCTNPMNLYTLRVYVPPDFPNSRPDMVVIWPHPLKGYAGRDLGETSASMHTLSALDGYVQICHYKDWSPDLTLYFVVLKGRIWLEAFEGHKSTGQPLDHYLSHMA